ncbi:MAG: DUF503 domain-containing protein [Gemmatimonadales bacterium]|nr:MAG: DUF503 domain-containing protein [Gemmatimonadales bacterium]
MATVVALLHLKLFVPGSQSLKDKRQVIKSLKDRLGRSGNLAVAEVDLLDDRRQAVLAVAMVSNDRRHLEGALQQVVHAASREREMILLDHQTEWL